MSEMNASVLKKEYVALKDTCLLEWQRTSDGSKNIFTESFFDVPQQIVGDRESKDGLRSGLSSGRPDLGEVVRLDAQPSEAVRLNVHETKNASQTASRSEEAARPDSQPAAPKVASPTRPAFTPRATISPTGIIERPRQDVGRDDRRKIVLALIKQKPALTVKDIAKSIPGVSEKTIQRELFAMVADGILTKRGDRRWSTYSLAV
jgi:DNA-binding transcriptional ArsR family regulator